MKLHMLWFLGINNDIGHSNIIMKFFKYFSRIFFTKFYLFSNLFAGIVT